MSKPLWQEKLFEILSDGKRRTTDEIIEAFPAEMTHESNFKLGIALLLVSLANKKKLHKHEKLEHGHNKVCWSKNISEDN